MAIADIEVTTIAESLGQFVTIGAQLVIVNNTVLNSVDVVKDDVCGVVSWADEAL